MHIKELLCVMVGSIIGTCLTYVWMDATRPKDRYFRWKVTK